MTLLRTIFLVLLIGCAPALAQDDDLPDAQELAAAAAKRFPQPVRVGDLLNRRVLEPMESQPTLGRVHAVVRQKDGMIVFVIDYYEGWLGLHSRPIGVPADAMVLLGQFVEVMDIEKEQLEKFPAFDSAGTTPLPPDAIIRVGLTKPAH